MNIREQTFDTGLVIINYVEGPPSGPPLVLLHGGNARWQSFDGVIPNLAAHWHLYIPELRGHGKSGRVPTRYRLQDYVDDVTAFLERQIGEPVLLFGHSLGGIVALMVTGQQPALVRALALGDSPLTRESWWATLHRTLDKLAAWRDLAGDQHTIDEIMEALKNAPAEMEGQKELVPMRQVYGEDSPVFEWLATNLYQSDSDVLTALIDDFENTVAGYDMDTLMSAIRCPVLLLQADPAVGSAMPDTEIAVAQRLLSHCIHVQLRGVSHTLHHVHKDEVLQALCEFFESVIHESDAEYI